jgi:hypothetical protein
MSSADIAAEQLAANRRRPQWHRSKITNGRLLPPGIDMRSLWARRFRDVLLAHVQDLGGEDATSTAERSILRRAATLTVQLELMETKFAREGDASPDELDLYSRTAANMRRLLESVGIRRRPKEVQSLASYLSGMADEAEGVQDAEIVIDGDTTTAPERRMGDHGCEPQRLSNDDDEDDEESG